jgi:AAA family ATP:ADP antiporter
MRIDPAYRARCKAIVDGVCGKFGKSGGSVLTSIFLALSNTNDIRDAALLSFFFVALFCILWIRAVSYLSKKYETSVANNVDIDIDLVGEPKKPVSAN